MVAWISTVWFPLPVQRALTVCRSLAFIIPSASLGPPPTLLINALLSAHHGSIRGLCQSWRWPVSRAALVILTVSRWDSYQLA
jgi:hypothetical protein